MLAKMPLGGHAFLSRRQPFEQPWSLSWSHSFRKVVSSVTTGLSERFTSSEAFFILMSFNFWRGKKKILYLYTAVFKKVQLLSARSFDYLLKAHLLSDISFWLCRNKKLVWAQKHRITNVATERPQVLFTMEEAFYA